MQVDNFGLQSANFGQIVTCFIFYLIGYDLATELCLFLTFQCLFFRTYM